jgi:hypothetical protein
MEFAKVLVAEVAVQVARIETQLRMSAYAQAISLTLMRLLSCEGGGKVLAQVEELETQLRMSAYAQAISLTLMRLLSSVRV